MEVIAHRGMPRQAPENTLAGFALAIEAHADGIELDVHATRDGVVVVHHDPSLPRPVSAPAGETGRAIASVTLAELRVAIAGVVEVPTLEETLALVAGRATVYVEIKAAGIESLVVDCLRRYGGSCAVHSFDHRVSSRVHELNPALPTGVLSASYLLEPERALRVAGGRDFWQWWEMIDAPLVERVHHAGGRVVAWTVNAPEHVVRLEALGVDAICTDVPDQMARIVRGAHVR
ncbi:MAG: glycerophosphoryl diester phosphodiesterase [Gemmatimonadota bacterium]